MNDEDSEDILNFVECLSDSDLKNTLKRNYMLSTTKKKAGKRKIKHDAVDHLQPKVTPEFSSQAQSADNQSIFNPSLVTEITTGELDPGQCKNLDLVAINLENIPIVEKIGDQFIELRSDLHNKTPLKTTPDFNFKFKTSPCKSTENLTPLVCMSTQSTVSLTANAQSNKIASESYDFPVNALAPLGKASEVFKVPADDVAILIPNDMSEMLPKITPPALRVVLKEKLLNQPQNNSPEITAPLVCSPPPSPSIIEASTEDQYSPNLAFPDISIQNSLSSPLLTNTHSSPNKVIILSDVPYHGDMADNKKRKSKATKDPKLWQRSLAKEKREKGESYLGYRRDKSSVDTKFKVKHDVFKPARSLKPACTSAFCVRSKLRACDAIDSDSRHKLFATFWKNMSWDQRRAYICSHVLKIEKKVTKNPDSNRGESRAYYLTIEHERHQVCKKMFLATLGIKDWFVRYWLDKTDCAMPPDTQTSQNQRKGPEKTASKEYLTQFLTKLPKMPSHYCRQSTSKLYLEPVFDSMAALYTVYKNACEVDSQPYLGRKLFGSIFDKLNLALFHPKKDQCDVCCSHKTGNLSEEEYNVHVIKKNRARAEKATDKLFAQAESVYVFTQDVESVKMVPFLQASAIYYKTKLCVHNFTLYNLATHEVMCYWFDESNSNLEASVFASCVVDHISNTLNKKPLPVILYSDGCCAQNRNAILSNALLRLAIDKKVVITQKYLEKGHTQMECDSVHSAIECKLKGKEIFLPDQYVDISKKSRTHPLPYEGKLLDYKFFTDFSKELIYKSIRPGKKVGDPVVTDIRVLEYNPNGTIMYKTDFEEELKPLPLRPTPLHRIRSMNDLPKLYTERLKIAKRKYQDLQDLKSVIPERCHIFYDQLPHD